MEFGYQKGRLTRCDPNVANLVVANLGSRKDQQKLRGLLGPIHKRQWAKQKFKKSGHQKFLLDFTQSGRVAILLYDSKSKDLTAWHEQLRSAVGDLRIDQKLNIFVAPEHDEVQGKDSLEAFLEACVLSAWDYPKPFGKKKDKKAKKLSVKIQSPGLNDAEKTALVKKALAFGSSRALVQTLGHTPGNFLTPAKYLDLVKAHAKKEKLSLEFISEATLKKNGAGAFLAVSQASSKRDAGIVRLRYNSKAKGKKKICFVGKGICFDTGGYNVKTGDYMFGMHMDMLGSAVALGMITLCAKLKVDFQVEAWLALAENHISPDGFKMNDVVQASNGTSIEITHTDAEGRMVLADTLALASKNYAPDIMFDYATLTGSCIRALGTQRVGVFTNKEEHWTDMIQASRDSGERVWHFPIGYEYENVLESKIADTIQCSLKYGADQILATTFLNKFVDPKINWFHMDLSTADHGKPVGLSSTDGSSTGLRWSWQLLERLLASP